MAKAMKVFLCAVKYRHGESTYYKGINKFSDRTKGELRRIAGSPRPYHNRHTGNDPAGRNETVHGNDNNKQDLAMDVRTARRIIEAALNESAPEHEYVAQQLRSLSSKNTPRVKRDTENSTPIIRDLGLRDLIRVPINIRTKVVAPVSLERLTTINKNYVPFETLSWGLKFQTPLKPPQDLSVDAVVSIGKSSQQISKLASKDPMKFIETLEMGTAPLERKNAFTWLHKRFSPVVKLTEKRVDWTEKQPNCFMVARDQIDCGA